MLWYNKFLILFVVLISTVSCSNNTKLIPSNKVKYFEFLSSIYVEEKKNRTHQITRNELEKILNSSENTIINKKTRYLLIFDLTETISGNILSTSLNTMSVYVSFRLKDLKNDVYVYSDNFTVISSFGSVISLYGREQAQKNTVEKLALSSSSEIYLRLSHFFNSNEIK